MLLPRFLITFYAFFANTIAFHIEEHVDISRQLLFLTDQMTFVTVLFWAQIMPL